MCVVSSGLALCVCLVCCFIVRFYCAFLFVAISVFCLVRNVLRVRCFLSAVFVCVLLYVFLLGVCYCVCLTVRLSCVLCVFCFHVCFLCVYFDCVLSLFMARVMLLSCVLCIVVCYCVFSIVRFTCV